MILQKQDFMNPTKRMGGIHLEKLENSAKSQRLAVGTSAVVDQQNEKLPVSSAIFMKDSTCVSSYPHSMLNHQEMLYIISDLNYQYSVLTCNCRLRQTSAAPQCSEHTSDNSECAH